jgi:hypothetical protein
MSPFAFFGIDYFFIRGLFDKPVYIFWSCLFFHRRSFLMSPFAFYGVASFFIRGLFNEPMNKGSESTPLFVAPLVCAKTLVECQANLVSYFNLALP